MGDDGVAEGRVGRSLFVVRFFEYMMEAHINVHDVNFLDGPALAPSYDHHIRGHMSILNAVGPYSWFDPLTLDQVGQDGFAPLQVGAGSPGVAGDPASRSPWTWSNVRP